ncbi:hypothetical protein DASC09_038070 [Saccharomycopsis crataegensis]|uniref:Pre-mRNA-splicing factor n=1 Tax=Saccharomycopsis crataegensis TaxID=43959 RepID=A0AAV5QPH0_9ASCO|nr:hypothetical protein DASC09_038070 [Saccharomycopsis crataegensis]
MISKKKDGSEKFEDEIVSKSQVWINVKKQRKLDTKLIHNILKSTRSLIISKKCNLKSVASILDSVNYLELYLWENVSEDSTNDHIISIALIFKLKSLIEVPIWSVIDDAMKFKILVKRVFMLLLSISLQPSILPKDIFNLKYLISFVDLLVNNLDNAAIRKQIAPFFSIGLFSNLANAEQLLNQYPFLKKSYNSLEKKLAKAQDKSELNFQRTWFYSFIDNYQKLLFSARSKGISHEDMIEYNNSVFCLLIDIISQLPTRRFANTILKEMNLMATIQSSATYRDERLNKSNSFYMESLNLLKEFIYFPIDDFSGLNKTEDLNKSAYELIETLKQVAHVFMPDRLKGLTHSSLSEITDNDIFHTYFNDLSLEEVMEFSRKLGIDTCQLPKDMSLMIESIYFKFIGQVCFSSINKHQVYLPTERDILKNFLLFDEDAGTEILSRPLYKLGSQYLSFNDFLNRNFHLYCQESFYQIRNDIENVINRLKVKKSNKNIEGDNWHFAGTSKYALKIKPLEILDVSPVSIESKHPSYVKAEVQFHYHKLPRNFAEEWDSLSKDEVVFLVSLEEPSKNPKNYLEKYGIKHMVSATVIELLDGHGQPLKESKMENQNENPRNNKYRRLYVNMDPYVFNNDDKELYGTFNAIIRRKKKENNFCMILESVRALLSSEINLPNWIADILLGYGDPTGESYKNQHRRASILDFSHVFDSFDHLKECLPNYEISTQYGGDASNKKRKTSEKPSDDPSIEPPFMLDFGNGDQKKVNVLPFKAHNYNQLISGRQGKLDFRPLVHFTKSQVDAIISGLSPGLTLILGPPGTGKTDVATQIVSSIVQNFSFEKTLIITHSNHGLNHIFTKINDLGTIDGQHLLRLGHGGQYLYGDKDEESFSKFGRVENALNDIPILLDKVNKLSESLSIEGYHGNSCETSLLFFNVYIKRLWKSFLYELKENPNSNEVLINKFPFKKFLHEEFKTANLFDESAEFKENVSEAAYYYGCVATLFEKLQSYRPFEVLRSSKERSNYMLVKQAKVVAMTATHLAMRLKEFRELGVEFDTIIIEEAGQLTELESFLPLALTGSSSNSLKRFILIGDYKQNSPIIQNKVLSDYSNFNHSLFEIFCKMGVPTIQLSDQGRSRESLCDLYSHVYETSSMKINTLPNMKTDDFTYANPGFGRVYQLIDVDKFQGKGELEPTPNFYQNLGEAEYAVSLYSYMRLLGYPKEKIVILTMYAGQKFLIEDILKQRCGKSKEGSQDDFEGFTFGHPEVSTVDNYQGREADYVILSIVRTKRLGYIRDIKRMTVALSRAKLGLYVLGNAKLLSTAVDPELKQMISKLVRREPDGNHLDIVTGELFSDKSKREEVSMVDKNNSKSFKNIEEFGKYVYDMTIEKLNK